MAPGEAAHRKFDLEELGQARFGGLSQAELELLRAAPKGKVAWCGPSHDRKDAANDPRNADAWGAEREVRAELIRWLCANQDAASRVDPRGVRMYSAKIVGVLDLSFVSARFPLLLKLCRLTNDADLLSAEIPRLDLNGSVAKSIRADGIRVTGDVFLAEGFTVEGEVRLLGAQIGGDLDCGGGTFKNPGSNALFADCARVTGSVFLNKGFTTEGEVRLLGAEIGGDLACRGGTIKNPAGRALSADRARVTGDVFLDEGFSAEGEVRLLGAEIGGGLDCSGGTFKNPGGDALSADRARVTGSVFLDEGFTAEGEVRLPGAQIGGVLDCRGGTFKNPAGKALSVDRARVTGSVFLREGFTAEGEVRLLGAEIGGTLACRGSTFKNPAGKALHADRARVTGSVFLDEGFTAEGAVLLLGAQIGGNLDSRGGTFTELVAQTAIIKGVFFWRAIRNPLAAKLDVRNATAGSIADDEPSWPAQGNLRLDGFVYGRISEGPTDAEKRLEWLGRLTPFTLQPYRQLAKVLRETGDDRGARRVLFEMERRRRQEVSAPWYSRAWAWVLRVTIGYGYYPERALWGLLLLVALGFAASWMGYFRGALAPTDKGAYEFFRARGYPPPYYDAFHASIYSLENTFPLVRLGQADRWAPDPSPAEISQSPVNRVSRWLGLILSAPVLRWFRWAQICLGWILATLFVAGVTGIVRREQ